MSRFELIDNILGDLIVENILHDFGLFLPRISRITTDFSLVVREICGNFFLRVYSMSMDLSQSSNTADDLLINVLQSIKTIPAADQQLIKENFISRSVKTGEMLLTAGAIARELFFIEHGVLKITSANEKGNPVARFFLKEGQFCTILNSLNNNQVSDESIVAACDCELLVISKTNLLFLYQQLDYFEQMIAKITTQTLIAKIQMINSYMGEDASTRYLKFLERQPEIALRVSLADIASYLGVTQQSLSRIRRNLR